MSNIPYDLPVSTKNLENLEEMMRQEALASKKCAQYSQFFSDSQLKSMCTQLQEHHKQRFNTLYNYLESNK